MAQGLGIRLFALAEPVGLSPLLILTLCGSERVLVASMEPPDVLSCWTTPGVGCPGDRAVARAVDQVHPDAHSESMLDSECGGAPPPPPPFLPMFEADSQSFASAPSVPRGFRLQTFGRDHTGCLGGGGPSQTPLPAFQ